MMRKPCLVCSATEGPSIFADQDGCSIWCQKVLSGEWSIDEWEKRTNDRARDGR